MSVGGNIAAIRARDKRRCWMCGHGVSMADASRDHVKARSEGGYNRAKNYRLAHRECNHARGPLPFEEVVRIMGANPEATPTRLRELLRAAAKVYVNGPEHAERRRATSARPEVRLRIAKAERKARRAGRS